jgi:polysaccharide export outer membrane protein
MTMQTEIRQQGIHLATMCVVARKRYTWIPVWKDLFITLVLLLTAKSISSQQRPAEITQSVNNGTVASDGTANLPFEPIGPNDLLGIYVYDAPELTRSIRVDADGTIRLPMVQKHILAAGLTPEDLEKSVRAVLIDEQVLVDPIVTVSVIEYRSRPINVIGEVKNPMTFQATGTVTLFEAISRAGGLTENAGPEVIVSSLKRGTDPKDPTLVRRIPVADLLNSMDPAVNMLLEGGELIRVPEAGHFYVLGNVRDPGVFTIRNGSETTVLIALTLSKGLQPYPGKFGYIYRSETGNGRKNEIPVELKKIIDHELPDVQLQANDILYVPEATGRKNTASIARTVAMIGAGMATGLLYLYH